MRLSLHSAALLSFTMGVSNSESLPKARRLDRTPLNFLLPWQCPLDFLLRGKLSSTGEEVGLMLIPAGPEVFLSQYFFQS